MEYSIYIKKTDKDLGVDFINAIMRCTKYEVKEVDSLVGKYSISLYYNNDYIGSCRCDSYEIKEEE